MKSVDLTVLVTTYNRSSDLREMLATALSQHTGGAFTYEVIVVDNNSTDNTREVVEEFISRGHSNLRYLFEPRQGRSFALNNGLQAACGRIYTLVDDDLILPPNRYSIIHHTFSARPEISFLGGKVLPLWMDQPPSWLIPKHWSAIAMADYGESEFNVDINNQVCLLAGSFRVEDVLKVGGYDCGLSVSADRIGGIEDVDLMNRLYRTGARGLYLPSLTVFHKVTRERLTKKYHRRWHSGHGRFYALMRDAEIENSVGQVLGVPAHFYRQAATDTIAWLGRLLIARYDEAFWHETRLRFFVGFFKQRRAGSFMGASFARGLAGFLKTIYRRRSRSASLHGSSDGMKPRSFRS